MQNRGAEAPSVPLMEGGNHNLEALANKLLEIKKETADKFPDTNKIVIQAEPQINYQLLVATMDATRSIVVNQEKISLFPDVSLAAGIL